VTRGRGRSALALLALFASFCAGVLVDGWLRTYGPPKPVQAAAKPSQTPAEPMVAAAATRTPTPRTARPGTQGRRNKKRR